MRRFGFVIAACAAAVLGASLSGAATTAKVDLHKLPLGDSRTRTSDAQRGWLYECRVQAGGGGAFQNGPWIDSSAGTYDLTAKPTVDGRVKWGQARVRIRRLSGGRTRISGNGLPVGSVTGTFPIASSDDAYQYDRNPNSISAQRVSVTLPRARRASAPSCVDGMVGYAVNGVPIFNAVDGENRDAVAHELQDRCGGHPERTGAYHYHSIPSCLRRTTGSGNGARVVGWAFDGYPIVWEKGVTNAALDACHGRTSRVRVFGKRVRTYHYDATYEFPYTVGCYRGTPLRMAPPG